jgi:N-acetylglucosamine malate deacetylase 2
MKALLIFAHPDDETFGCGGTIAKLTKDGVTVNLITATIGQAGMTGEYGDITPEELGRVREKEHAEAAKILGISKIHYLGLMDGEVNNHEVSELVEMLMPLLEKENPDIVITFEKNGASNHPDHKQMSQATTDAFRKWMKLVNKHVRLYYLAVPVSYLEAYEKAGLSMKAFGEALGTPDEEITTVVDISETFEIKDKAAQMHISQASDWERFGKRSDIVDLKKEYFELVAENSLT